MIVFKISNVCKIASVESHFFKLKLLKFYEIYFLTG